MSFVHALKTIPAFNVGLHLRLSIPMDDVHVVTVIMNIVALITESTIAMLVVEVTQPLLIMLLFFVFHQQVFIDEHTLTIVTFNTFLVFQTFLEWTDFD